METNISLDRAYIPSKDVVAREIHGELIIVPIASGAGNLENDIFTLNETGRAIWDRLDGKKSLKDVAQKLSAEFKAPAGRIEKDVIGIAAELFKRRMLVESGD